jgi:protein associated with RNAse G/E
MKKIVTVNARKYNGKIHKTWKCDLIERNKNLLIFEGVFQDEIKHIDLGIIRPGTVSYEYYWLDRWYNVFRFHEPEGTLRNYYCNVNMPPTFESGVLDYVDLDLDVLISRNFKIEILDFKEFEMNSKKFNYTEETVKNVRTALTDLINLVFEKRFPFDFPHP